MTKTTRIKFPYCFLISAFLFLTAFSAQAQFHPEGNVFDNQTDKPVQSFSIPGDSTKNVTIQEIVVKAFQSDRRLIDLPASIDIITNRQILREPTFTLAPTINKTTGVWMQSGSINTNRLTIRGIGTRSPYGSNKIRAYYGDIPLTNGVGETTLEDLDLEQITNIELLKGPSSGFYGSGLGGVLLFNPLKPNRNIFTQTVSVGSYQTIKYSGKLSIASKNSGNSLVYSRLHSNGYRENNETNRHNLTWTSTFTKKQTTVDLLAAFVKMDASIPSSIDLKTFQETPQKAAANWAAAKGYEDYSKFFGGISVKQNFSKNRQAKLSTFGQFNKNNELRPFNILQEKNDYLGFRAVIEKKVSFGKTTGKLVLGDEYFNENYQWQTLRNANRVAGDLLSDNQEYRRYNNLFFLTDLNIQEKWLLSASLNWNGTRYKYEDRFLSDGDQSGKHQFNPVISPRLSISWHASENIRFFSVISQGFSPPTLEETLMPNGQRNTAIKPETGWNYELGSKASIGKSIYLEVSAYYMKVKNLLVARRTAEDAYMGINAGGTNHQGLELKMDYKLIDQTSWSTWLRMNANLTRYRFADFTDNGNDYSGNKLTGTPASITNWMLETNQAKGFFLNLHYQTVGKMPMRDDNSLFTDAYQLANLMAGYGKTYQNLSVNISAGIQNLLDTHYASMILINATAIGNQSPRYYYPGMPRNYKTTLNLRYLF